jgi:hypothetical protein
VSGRRARARPALAVTAAVLLAGAGVAIAGRSSRAGADATAVASRFIEPKISPRCVPPRLNISAALAGARVTVSPGPESRDSSASTQLSMLGPPAGQISHVTVKGSVSGAHAGRLAAYSQGNGASFLPSTPLTQGEKVSVRAELRDGAAVIPFAWSFTVAVQDHGGVAGGSPRPAPQKASYQSFHSRADLQPPTVAVTARAAEATPGDIFIAPYSGPGQYGPMILGEDGSLIWFKPLFPVGARASDFRVQQYEGEPVLTWWQDPLTAGGQTKAGEVIMDSSYRQLAVVRAGNGYQADLHEFQITPQGTALITVYDGIDCDLSSVGGPRDAAVADTLFQEVDLKTGLVIYEWHSLDHVAMSSSYASAKRASRTTPFDYFHINSVDVRSDGDLLVDARNTWAAYNVDRSSGRVRWQLGGRGSSFAMGPGTRTAWQHDAREQPDGTITLFDNGATPAVHAQSRAIQVRLDPQSRTATLVRQAGHPAKALVAGSQGNLQPLAGGAWLVGWGEVPYVSEFSAGGQLLFDAHLPAAYESYRAYRLAWSGVPTQPPAIAAVRSSAGKGAVLYASWNGATRVAYWRVLEGKSPSALTPAGQAPRGGFETSVSLPGAGAGSYVQAQALDAAGAVIGVSPVKRI